LIKIKKLIVSKNVKILISGYDVNSAAKYDSKSCPSFDNKALKN
jgi:hypothetical protein